jgi:hypothetical protein
MLKLQAHNLQNTLFWDVIVHTLVETDEYLGRNAASIFKEKVSLARKNSGGYTERAKGQLGIKSERKKYGSTLQEYVHSLKFLASLKN